jgi:hypothetical protein
MSTAEPSATASTSWRPKTLSAVMRVAPGAAGAGGGGRARGGAPRAPAGRRRGGPAGGGLRAAAGGAAAAGTGAARAAEQGRRHHEGREILGTGAPHRANRAMDRKRNCVRGFIRDAEPAGEPTVV